MTSSDKQRELATYVAAIVVLLVLIPMMLDAFWLSLVGKYLAFAFVAVGLVLSWGYGGMST